MKKVFVLLAALAAFAASMTAVACDNCRSDGKDKSKDLVTSIVEKI